MVTRDPTTQPIEQQAEVVHISAEDYMANYAEQHYEWLNGEVIAMSPVHIRHDLLTQHFMMLLRAYLSLRPIGQIHHDPFAMRLPNIESYRQPDIQIILNSNPNGLKPTYMDGPADICIEIVSPASVVTDRGVKYEEYAKGGVKEYWLIDPMSKEARFYRLNDENIYISQELEDHYYQTNLLPSFKLHVPTLWQINLPDYFEIAKIIQEMLKT